MAGNHPDPGPSYALPAATMPKVRDDLIRSLLGDVVPITGVAIHDGALFRFDSTTVSIQKIRDLTEEELAAIDAYTTLVEFSTARPPKTNTRTRG